MNVKMTALKNWLLIFRFQCVVVYCQLLPLKRLTDSSDASFTFDCDTHFIRPHFRALSVSVVVGLEVHYASALNFNAIYIKVAACAALCNANIQHFLKPRV